MEPQKTPAGQSSDKDMPGTDSGAMPQDSQGDTNVGNSVAANTVASSEPSVPSEEVMPETSVPAAGQTIKPQAATPVAESGSMIPPAAVSGEKVPAPTDEVPAPSAAMGASAPIPTPAAPHKRGKKGLLIGLIAAATFLLLSGGGAAAYYYHTVNKPENVLKQALANSFDTEKFKTVQFNGDVAFTEEQSDVEVKATYKGSADNKTGAFDISGDVDVFVAKITYDMKSPDGKSFYLRAGGLDGLSDLLSAYGEVGQLYAPIIDVLNNQWIEVNESVIKQFDSSYKKAVLTEADGKKLATAYEQNPFLVIKETLADEEVGGQKSHHYKVVIDETLLKSFLKALKNAKLDSYSVSQDSLDQVDSALGEVALDKYPIEVWISKKDKMFTRMTFKTDFSGGSVDISFAVVSYNKAVKVEKPAGAKSILEIMSEFTGGATDLPLSASALENGISL